LQYFKMNNHMNHESAASPTEVAAMPSARAPDLTI